MRAVSSVENQITVQRSLKNVGDTLWTYFGEGHAWWHANHTEWLQEEKRNFHISNSKF